MNNQETTMNDFELYASGFMNADEREQWDHVTAMMAERGEYDGKARDDLHKGAADMADEDEEEFYGPFRPCDEEIEF
jgi:hypothetical protein